MVRASARALLGHGSPTRERLKRLLPMLPPLYRVLIHVRSRVAMWREYTPDRHVLEQVIFACLKERDDMQRLLFVGCDWYTRRYPKQFGDREFWTLEKQREKARYGSYAHVIDTLANARSHFDAQSLDAVICNGVLGWGLDTPEETEDALAACFGCLRPGGLLIIGWADIDARRPVSLETLSSLKAVEPYTLPPFPGPTYPTFSDLNQIFAFYQRPTSAPSGGRGADCLDVVPRR